MLYTPAQMVTGWRFAFQSVPPMARLAWMAITHPVRRWQAARAWHRALRAEGLPRDVVAELAPCWPPPLKEVGAWWLGLEGSGTVRESPPMP